jgi:CubicO group peptidase (beta-lactamase class C family)
VKGVDNLDPNFPPAESPSPTLLGLALYRANIEQTLAWAGEMQIKHLLSHTSGLLRSGSPSAAADHFDEDESNVTYKQIHLAVLEAVKGPPFEFEPGTKSVYSNHGFGLLGHIVAETSGRSFEQFVRQRILQPLGLSGIVRGGTHTSQYATPYGKEDHPLIPGAWVPKPKGEFKVATVGLAAGGWAATAQDLVRLMCGMDKKTSVPILEPATVAWMDAIAYPKVDPRQPLGWDNRSGDRLVKNGVTDAGGMAEIAKFLPGALGKEEINVAFATNVSHSPNDIVTFLQTLAQIVAVQEIPSNYDLFDPAHRCSKLPTAPTKVAAPPPAGPTPTAEPKIGSGRRGQGPPAR